MTADSRRSSPWTDYNRRMRWFFGIWMGGFAVSALVIYASQSTRYEHVVFWLSLGTWIFACIVAKSRLMAFRCPKCGQRFFNPYWPYPEKCRHCGVARGR